MGLFQKQPRRFLFLNNLSVIHSILSELLDAMAFAERPDDILKIHLPGFPRHGETGKKSGILKCCFPGRESRERVGNSIHCNF